LTEISCVLVLRNKLWFEKAALPALYNIWEMIEHDKIHGYEHRAPNRKTRNVPFISENKPNNECLINIHDMLKNSID
jgi:hypothetical protein